MSFGHFIDPKTKQYTDDHLISKAMEALRMQFGSKLPEEFYGKNWERARLILKVEGRATDIIIKSLMPFAKAAVSPMARSRRVDAQTKRKYPHMARMIEKGML